MIKLRAIEEFTLNDFDKLSNIQRYGRDEKGKIFINDTFECDEKMVDYLTGNNALNKVVVKVIEVKPEKEEKVEIEKPKKKKTTKK